MEREDMAMRMSQLAEASGVPVATIKFYLREQLLPEGVRSSATQALYDERHLDRLRLIRALVASGVSLAATHRVVAAMEPPIDDLLDLLGTATAAIVPELGEGADLEEAQQLALALGWTPGACDEAVLASLAHQLQVMRTAGHIVPPEVMQTYIASVREIARAEIEAIPSDSSEGAVRYVVLGTLLVEPLLLALRRVADQIAATARYSNDDSGLEAKVDRPRP